MDSLGSLNVFMRAADTRNFTAAGQQLGISSSAVGKAISRLESRLGVRLFNRSTRSVVLTPEGGTFLNRCHRIMGEIEAAETEIAQAATTPHGKLRVSMPLVGMLLTPAIAGFIEAYPKVELDLDFSDRVVDVYDEGFDVVIRLGTRTDDRLVSKQFGTFSYVMVGSPAYFAARGTPALPCDLDSHACLRYRYPSTGKLEDWALRHKMHEPLVALSVTAVASMVEPLIAMAENGLGIIYVPAFAVRHQLEEGTLVAVLAEFVCGAGVINALWPSARQMSPKIEAFVETLAKHLFPASDTLNVAYADSKRVSFKTKLT
jgi:DNA-binding transcriptional LysR family regulator